MRFIELMKHRYTTKVYDNNQKIDNKLITELKEVLQLSPSSINSQPWQFIFINEQATRNQLAKASFHNKERIENCDTLIVFQRFDNIALFEADIVERLPEYAVAYYNQHVKPLGEVQIRAWFDRQVYLSLGVLLSACASMSIDATPMEGIDTKQYDAIIKQPNFSSVVAAAIGVRHQDDFNQPSKKAKLRKSLADIIHTI